MKKRNNKLVFAGISLLIGLVLILAGGIVAFLAYSPFKLLEANEVIVYILVACAGLAFVLVLVSAILIAVNAKAREKEEEKLLSDIEASAKGEKLLLEEKGSYYGPIARGINRSRLLKEKVDYAYGVYKEGKFDQIVLDTLENEVIAKAGLAYFVMSGNEPIRTNGPRDALLYMLQAHFGEKAYYGVIRHGIAVFAPILSSKEGFLGRVRRTVQLFSYSEESNHIASKAGVAFYPDFPPRLLTAEALKGTLEQLSLNVHDKAEVVPHMGYDAAEKEAFLLHKMKFLDSINEAKNLDSLDTLYKDFAETSLPYVFAGSVGVALYRPKDNIYEVLSEISTEEGASFSLTATDKKLPAGLIDPFYEWSKKEKGYACAEDAIFMPEPLCTPMESLGIASIAVLSVSLGEEPVALIYATHKEKGRFVNNKIVLEFLEVSRSYVLARMLLEAKEASTFHEDVLLSSFDHYAYGVSRDSFNLSYVSPNLAKAIPQASVGKVCYEALFGLKKPCQHCPLLENDVEKMIPRLASGVFAYKGVQGDGETMLILSPHKADFSPSRLDPNTGLLSDKSLHEDLQSEILLKDSVGVILAFRIRNVDAIARLVRLTDYEEVVKAVSDALASAGLSRGLYRNGIAGFAYLLPFASKQDAYELAEKIGRKFAEKLLFHEREVEFVFDYAIIRYPLEAETPFALDAILRILYQKADASGRGRLFEVDNEKGRLVDIDYYMKTKLEEGLRAKRLPVSFTKYDELAGKHVAFLEASLSMDDELGQPIRKKLLDASANSLARGKDIQLAVINTVARFLGANREKISTSPLRGVIVNIDGSAFSENFVESVCSMLDNNKASKRHLYLQVDESLINGKIFAEFKRLARNKGLQIGLGNYKGDLLSHQIMDFAYVSFPAKSIYGAEKKEFLLSLANVRRAAVNVLVDGYRDNEERRYLGSLTFHYGKKEGEEPVKETDIEF